MRVFPSACLCTQVRTLASALSVNRLVENLSASELNRQLTNPVSSIWSISNQFNNFELNNGQWNNNWNFQPVLPVEPD